MKRVMSIWLPLLPIDLLRRSERRAGVSRDARAVLMEVSAKQRQVVACCCERATKAGVVPGLPVRQAVALFRPDQVRVLPLDTERNLRALRALAEWAHRFSPVVMTQRDDGLSLDVTGSELLFKREARLMKLAASAVMRLGFQARIVLASSFVCAGALARWGSRANDIVRPGDERRALAGLPIEALDVDGKTLERLHEVGLRHIGQLLEMPRSLLPARYGSEVVMKLDQALGQAIELVQPIRPIEPLRVERLFDGPTTQREAIELTVQDLLTQLSDLLQRRECGLTHGVVELGRCDLGPVRLAIRLSRPHRDARHLWSMVRPHVERAHLGFGVERIAITAGRTGTMRHEQAICLSSDPGEALHAERLAGELDDALVNRLGTGRVLRLRLKASHLPEAAFAFEPVIGALQEKADAPGPEEPIDRPTLLFERAEPARVTILSPQGPVVQVAWRGGEHAIAATVGPERLAPEWWRKAGPLREYYKLCEADTGRWLWLCRTIETGRWYVHGVWA
jgi:protein ImuB